MDRRRFLPVLLAFGLLAPAGVAAQPSGAPALPGDAPVVSDPLEDVDATGSFEPTVIPAFPTPRPDVRVTGNRPGCALQIYVVGSGQEVRVYRC